MSLLVLLRQRLWLIIAHCATSIRAFKLDTEALLRTDFLHETILAIGSSICLLTVVAMVTISCCKKKDSSIDHSDDAQIQQFPSGQNAYANPNGHPQLERYHFANRPLPPQPTTQWRESTNLPPATRMNSTSAIPPATLGGVYANAYSELEGNESNSQYANKLPSYVNLGLSFQQNELQQENNPPLPPRSQNINLQSQLLGKHNSMPLGIW